MCGDQGRVVEADVGSLNCRRRCRPVVASQRLESARKDNASRVSHGTTAASRHTLRPPWLRVLPARVLSATVRPARSMFPVSSTASCATSAPIACREESPRSYDHVISSYGSPASSFSSRSFWTRAASVTPGFHRTYTRGAKAGGTNTCRYPLNARTRMLDRASAATCRRSRNVGDAITVPLFLAYASARSNCTRYR